MWVNNEVGPRVGAKKSLRFANDELVAAAARATVHTANVFLWPGVLRFVTVAYMPT